MTLASWLSLSRVILSPFILWQLLPGGNFGLALILITVAGVTDWLDGWAARARNEVSEMGKILDPLGDKVLLATVFVGFSIRVGLSWWLAAVYIGKELLQLGAGALLLRKNSRVISANIWGKASTGGFFLGFAVFLIQREIGLILIGIALLMSIYALVTYYREFQRSTRN